MMFLCSSVASDLSNYDSCESVHFCVLIQSSFCLVMSPGFVHKLHVRCVVNIVGVRAQLDFLV